MEFLSERSGFKKLGKHMRTRTHVCSKLLNLSRRPVMGSPGQCAVSLHEAVQLGSGEPHGILRFWVLPRSCSGGRAGTLSNVPAPYLFPDSTAGKISTLTICRLLSHWETKRIVCQGILARAERCVRVRIA